MADEPVATAARCSCCDMPMGRKHRAEADRQACGPCLQAENEARAPNLQTRHNHDDCPACREENYQRAKADPVASVVLAAMHQQDAATYNGQSNNMGQIALDAAATIRKALALAGANTQQVADA